jgi:putative transposase
MPRRPRLELPGCAMHLTQRGVNRCAVFLDDDDFSHYLQTIRAVFSSAEIQLHAYVLMTNHVHMLLTTPKTGVLSNAMRIIGTRYVPYFNAKYQRCGPLWQGRFKTCLVDSERYCLNVMRYIELNPVRALMSEAACDYRWSSAQYHVGDCEDDSLLSPHASYLDLGQDRPSRTVAYRAVLQQAISASDLADIRIGIQQERALGHPRFVALAEKTLNRPVQWRPAGRPIVNSNVNDLRPL